MAKDPAFLFYSSDFLAGIQDLTMEERGQYITLLCLQHQKGRLTEKMIKLACHGNAAADVLAKFRHDETGCYYNERLEAEAAKRRESSDKQRQRAQKRWKNAGNGATADAAAYTTAHAQQMPFYVNENESENEKKVGGMGEGLDDPPNEMEVAQAIEFIAITTRTMLTTEDLSGLWQAFCIQCEGQFYPRRFAKMNHFRNWIKNQITNGTIKQPTEQSSGRHGTSAARFDTLAKLE